MGGLTGRIPSVGTPIRVFGIHEASSSTTLVTLWLGPVQVFADYTDTCCMDTSLPLECASLLRLKVEAPFCTHPADSGRLLPGSGGGPAPDGACPAVEQLGPWSGFAETGSMTPSANFNLLGPQVNAGGSAQVFKAVELATKAFGVGGFTASEWIVLGFRVRV